MKKICIYVIIVLMIFSMGCTNRKETKEKVKETNSTDMTYEINMKRDLLTLMMAYPEYIVDLEVSSDNRVYLIMKSGNKILYDDKEKKNYSAKLNNPDLQDMLEEIYPLCHTDEIMEKNFDPGRIRSYALLKEVYGNSKAHVEKNLVAAKGVRFNKNNRAAESMKNVMNELLPLAKNNGKIGACVYPMSGTFCYRVISGTGRLSPHSFGIAIDLARDNRDYWKWASKEAGAKRLKSYPQEIVNIFEKNYFIWGGKWNHFDILHFEYRPEFIIKSKYFSKGIKEGEMWYSNVNINDEYIKKSIDLIDKKIK
ncbi:MAG: M15 family metallopeptidase [Anaeromicrobium sp.]|uniref:M15 family metallopeptidase n=1 Tax=Anaeromicrobium sp. TaxID=1929132 RepID=UPI0025DF6DA1|nr:M15 family metallopeptidase [Anaeromicrobium sp.]MCT4593455.1 M15 family metallopeptidase [Anaeromicrobium sp.]